MTEFMDAMKEVFPGLLVQFEDFSTDNAFRYLRMFQSKAWCFNDDVCISMLSNMTPHSDYPIDSRHRSDDFDLTIFNDVDRVYAARDDKAARPLPLGELPTTS